MDPRDFLTVADQLATGTLEAEWRSAVSRAYYSAFHVGRQVLIQSNFAIPEGPTGHRAVWLRLANAGVPEIAEAGNSLNSLRGFRNYADYDLGTPFLEEMGVAQVGTAWDIINILDQLVATPTALAQVVAAIQVYERDVLHEVTYQPTTP
jgi:uncharacterized protein (UPF0332 family)